MQATYKAVVESHVCNVALFSQGWDYLCAGGVEGNVAARESCGRRETGSFPEGDQGLFIAGVMRVEGRGKKGNSDGLYPVCVPSL